MLFVDVSCSSCSYSAYLLQCSFSYLQISSLFVRLLLQAGVQPTLDPSTETLCRSNALAQERTGIGWCMRDV